MESLSKFVAGLIGFTVFGGLAAGLSMWIFTKLLGQPFDQIKFWVALIGISVGVLGWIWAARRSEYLGYILALEFLHWL